ncbi:MAG: glycosyl transferase family 2 [Flavobacteriaceae bacterium]|nr:glycosyl transferase family 2 [Flavobacteriaceae bacterium]|tara:strand:+ start:77141 stop:77887 length:747 start_codon:yes stop_codon:yes gene_type:complete
MEHMLTKRILVIIPCYNEAKRLPVDRFSEFIKNSETVDFLFVDDGSTDGTAAMLEKLCATSDRFSFLLLKENQGKAGAIRQGVLQVKNKTLYEYVGYFDADLATPLSEIPYFISEIEKRNPMPLFVMGSRVARMGATIDRKAHRHYLGRVFATFVSNVLKLPVYDTQCGAKLIHHSIVFDLFQEPLLTKWLFDVELIARMEKQLGLEKTGTSLLEIPLNSWQEVGGSKLKFTDFLKAPWELIKIWRTL